MAQSILFVCSGNVFRSVTAEYSVRAQSNPQLPYRFESAGTKAKPQPIPLVISHHMIKKGIDPSAHVPRLLTKQLIDQYDLIIAMSQDHRELIHQQFGLTVPLFNEVALGKDSPILDLHEALPDWERDLREARHYMESVMDHIWESTPALITRLSQFLPKPVVSRP